MADTTIFKRLRRLFSTDVIIRDIGGGKLKVIDTNQIQQSGKVETNAVHDRFSRLYTGTNQTYNPAQNFQTLRTQLYSDYYAMDTDAIIASTLDVIADEATLKNTLGEVLQIKSSDENIQKVLYNLFYDVLNIEFNLNMWVRDLCKFGDFFLKLEIAEKYGVYNVIPYNPQFIVREEGYDPDNPTKVRFAYYPDGVLPGDYKPAQNHSQIKKDSPNVLFFDNYEVAHFRMIQDSSYLPYGRSYLEPARKIFKQYTLMEDAMLVHRIVRAPDKRVYKINVGNIPPAEVDAFMQKTINNFKRTPYVDPQTGEYNLKYNMQNSLEDFFIPIRGNDTTTQIETAPGLSYDGISDVEYLREKLFAALKIPKAYLGYEKDLSGKATLAAEDIRFARSIEKIQKIILSELYKVAQIHLYTQGYTGEQMVNFELNLTTPSIIFEQEKVNLLTEKVGLAQSMMDTNIFSSDWIYEHLFDMSEDVMNQQRDLVREDKKRNFRFTQIDDEGNDPLESGKSYGTPHDLASLYGKGRYDQDDMPVGYNEDEESTLGRPLEIKTDINKQEGNMGRDRLGKKEMHGKLDPISAGKGLALENELKSTSLNPNKKQIVFEGKKSKKSKPSLLDEENIKE